MPKHLLTSLSLIIISLTVTPLFAAEEPVKAAPENAAAVKEAVATEAAGTVDTKTAETETAVTEKATKAETPENAETVAHADTDSATEEPEATEEAETKEEAADAEPVSIMDLPVNFSTPEDVEKSMQAIEEQAGTGRVKALKAAMGYILAYDLGLRHDKDKMHKKLNGQTPNQIIARVKRK